MALWVDHVLPLSLFLRLQVTAKTGFEGAADAKKAAAPEPVLATIKGGAGGKGAGDDDGMMTPAKGGDKQLYLTEATTKLRSR